MDTAASAFAESLSRASSSASHARSREVPVASPAAAREARAQLSTHRAQSGAHRQVRTAPAPRSQPLVASPAAASKTAPAPAPQPFVTNERRGLISRHDLPDPLANTLDHIVGQLALIAETMALIDSRLTATEDRVSSIAEYLRETRGYEAPAAPVTAASVTASAPVTTTSSSEGNFQFMSNSTDLQATSEHRSIVANSQLATSQATSRQPSPKWQSASGFSFEYGSGSYAAPSSASVSAPSATSTTAADEALFRTESTSASSADQPLSPLPVVSTKYDAALTSTIASILRSRANASPRAVATVSGAIRDFAVSAPAPHASAASRYSYNQELEDDEVEGDDEEEIVDEEDLYNGADADNGDVEDVGDYDDDEEEEGEDDLLDEFA